MIGVITRIYCDAKRCPTYFEIAAATFFVDDLSATRYEAQQHGWSHDNGDGRDYCPKHTQENTP